MSAAETPRFDVVLAADPRFPGGTSTATLADARALRAMGLTVALLPAASSLLSDARPAHARLRGGLASAGVPWLDPAARVDTDLLLVTHPSLFPHMALRPAGLRPRAAVLVANHPPRIGAKGAEYDPAAVLEQVERLFGAPCLIAPISERVRELLDECGVPQDRLAATLPRIVDPAEWDVPFKVPRPGEPLVIGRHARPDPMKWPDRAEDILAAWPEHDDVRVDVLGGGPPDHLLDHIPWNWRIRPFTTAHPRDFLAGLDAYVSFHGRHWVEAFGMSVLEAMAAGRVVVVHPVFRAQFGPGALYGGPAEVMDMLAALRAEPDAWLAQGKAARRVAVERYGPDAFASAFGRLWRQCGLDDRRGRFVADFRRTPPAAPAVARPGRSVLFVSSNGTGLGHVTRLMAIARRLPPGFKAVFFTLSQAAAVVRSLGFPVDFTTAHQTSGIDRASWNSAFAQEFAAALAYHRPDCVVFDGSVPYSGLLDVLDARPGIVSIWVRRGLWKPTHSPDPLLRAERFTAVLEPADLCGREDAGPTAAAGDPVHRVPPIVLHDPAEGLNRAEAREGLGLPREGRVAAIQLGSRGEAERAALKADIVRNLLAVQGMTVVDVRSPLAGDGADEALPAGMIRRSVYPLSRHLAAFDLMITEAGYNSFHELVYAGVPTIFVPREDPEMDDQTLRARYAASAGLGFTVSPHAEGGSGPLISAALDPENAAEIARRSERLGFVNGAGEAARFIAETMTMLRAGRPLGEMVDR